MELKELNSLCKHMKNVRCSQPCISMNFCTEFSKAQVLPYVSIVNNKHTKITVTRQYNILKAALKRSVCKKYEAF